jgi:formamidopyrimidine-DNA glycosylase
MPELPDVEVNRRYLKRTALHRRVQDVSGPAATRAKPRRRLRGKRLDSTRRHGKYLFVGLGEEGAPEGWLVIHIGDGALKYYRRPEHQPAHPQLVLTLDDGYRLAYDAERVLEEVDVIDDPDRFVAEHKLGPDALAIDEQTFVDLIAKRRGSVKRALMDQSLLAGIGNVYSDEILYHAQLHPDTDMRELDEAGRRQLYRATRAVLLGAIDAGAEANRMPRTWLLPYRDTGGACPRCGAAFKKRKVGGRGAWFCPGCQLRPH